MSGAGDRNALVPTFIISDCILSVLPVADATDTPFTHILIVPLDLVAATCTH